MTTVKVTHFGTPFQDGNGLLNIHDGPVDECPDPNCASSEADES
jgi:hypothetical protein